MTTVDSFSLNPSLSWAVKFPGVLSHALHTDNLASIQKKREFTALQNCTNPRNARQTAPFTGLPYPLSKQNIIGHFKENKM